MFDTIQHSEVLIFLSSPLVWWCPLLILPCTYSFPSLKMSLWILDFVVLSLLIIHFSHLSFSSWHIFQYQILLLYPGCVFLLFVSESSVLFPSFKYLYLIHIHKGINFFPEILKMYSTSVHIIIIIIIITVLMIFIVP